MSAGDGDWQPKYDPELAAQAILLEVVDRHPQHLTVDQIVMRIASDSKDPREVDAARSAIRELRQADLVRCRDEDGLVEPTRAAIRAHALLSAL